MSLETKTLFNHNCYYPITSKFNWTFLKLSKPEIVISIMWQHIPQVRYALCNMMLLFAHSSSLGSLMFQTPESMRKTLNTICHFIKHCHISDYNCIRKGSFWEQHAIMLSRVPLWALALAEGLDGGEMMMMMVGLAFPEDSSHFWAIVQTET